MGYDSAFEKGKTFDQFVQDSAASQDMWHAMARRALHVQQAADRIRVLPGRWRLLALGEDWCGDAVNTLPVIARLAEAAGNVELRIVRRDEYPELMDRHLTNGSRSVPVVILLDEHGQAQGWWGPRPRALQQWFDRQGRRLPSEERYRELRRWYARDRGATTASEIADLIWCGAMGDGAPYRGTRPCESLWAA
ncbi:MAG: thioredoxin family protein [Gemmatimonadetes bacterium]|nr:thioredoxin family protein [Gemmatimonadota bacterium]